MLPLPLLLLAALAAQPAPAPAEPPAASAPAQPPRPLADLASYVRGGDYPMELLRAGRGGRVYFVLDVAADGRVEACRVTASSGYWQLDEVTCRIMRRRARFEPARAADGTPVPARHADALNWWIRGSRP